VVIGKKTMGGASVSAEKGKERQNSELERKKKTLGGGKKKEGRKKKERSAKLAGRKEGGHGFSEKEKDSIASR